MLSGPEENRVNARTEKFMTDILAALLFLMGYSPDAATPPPSDGGVVAQGGGIPVRPPSAE
jgi:hypothetical protein